MKNANPVINPANNDSLVGTFVEVLNEFKKIFACCTPASVLGVSLGPPLTVSVQPLIPNVDSEGNITMRGQIQRIPVVQFGGGGAFIKIPVEEGDIGYLIANDRDISRFVATGQSAAPATMRTHDLADSIFFPAMLRGYSLLAGDQTNLTIQTMNGSSVLSFRDNQIRATTLTFAVDGNITASGSISPNTPPP